jgi:alpha-aminoadipic semialdehyde synthase
MHPSIGIRSENDPHERRAPLIPDQVRQVVGARKVDVLVETSGHRTFADAAYEAAGARVVRDLSGANLILGLKEIPAGDIIPAKAHCFFSHTIKGQPGNMPMLRAFLDRRATLLDYEKVTDENGRRLIFFGPFAGYAGMVNTLWALGRRLREEGIETPFSRVRRALDYAGLAEARRAIREVGEAIARDGLPGELSPFICGFAGYGNVSRGAQEVFGELPVREIAPGAVAGLRRAGDGRDRVVHKVVFKEEHLVRPVTAGAAFDLQDYYDHPERYRGVFESYLPHLTVLVNCIYWEPRYPRLLTRKWLEARYREGQPGRLKVIGDITCDVAGSIECTVAVPDLDEPIYVYDPLTGAIHPGAAGKGPVVLAHDRLPTELPREASETFGEALLPFVDALAGVDYTRSLGALDLPGEFRRALIAHQGDLAPDFRYLRQHLDGR